MVKEPEIVLWLLQGMKSVTSGWGDESDHREPASRCELDVPKESPFAVLINVGNNFWRTGRLERWCLGPVHMPGIERFADLLRVRTAKLRECTAELEWRWMVRK